MSLAILVKLCSEPIFQVQFVQHLYVLVVQTETIVHMVLEFNINCHFYSTYNKGKIDTQKEVHIFQKWNNRDKLDSAGGAFQLGQGAHTPATPRTGQSRLRLTDFR